MKTSTAIKQLLSGACIYYTVASLLVLGISILIKGSLNAVVIGVGNVLLLFPFGVAMSGAQMILQHTKQSNGMRRLWHFLITLTAFYLFLWLPARAKSQFTGHLLALVLITLLYWVVILIAHLIKKRYHSLREE